MAALFVKIVKDSGNTIVLLICILLFLVNQNLYSQERGYIITKENEFKGGLIKFTN